MTRSLPITLIDTFVRELLHELRTPLSVISNELHLLKDSHQEAARAIAKVQSISTALQQLERVVGHTAEREEVLLSELIDELASSSGWSAQENIPGEAKWQVEKRGTTAGLACLLTVLEQGDLVGAKVLLVDRAQGTIQISLTKPFPTQAIGELLTLSEGNTLDIDQRSLLPLIDALLMHNDLVLTLPKPEVLRIEQSPSR